MHPQKPHARWVVVSMRMNFHSGGTGNIRHSPRNGWNGCSVISPGNRAFLPPSSAGLLKRPRKLDTSVGVSGSRGLTVRPGRARRTRRCGHRIPPPTFVTIAKRPLWRRDRRSKTHISFPKNGREIFLRGELGRLSRLKYLGKLICRRCGLRALDRVVVAQHVRETARRANQVAEMGSLARASQLPRGARRGAPSPGRCGACHRARIRATRWHSSANHAGSPVASILAAAMLLGNKGRPGGRGDLATLNLAKPTTALASYDQS